MEHNILHSIAKAVFDAMDVSSWKQNSLDEIELHTQKLISEIANTLLQDFVLPSRINDIEQALITGRLFVETVIHPLKSIKQTRLLTRRPSSATKSAFVATSTTAQLVTITRW